MANITITNTGNENLSIEAAMYRDMANEQLEQGWTEVDEDMYQSVAARLGVVNNLVKRMERIARKLEK